MGSGDGDCEGKSEGGTETIGRSHGEGKGEGGAGYVGESDGDGDGVDGSDGEGVGMGKSEERIDKSGQKRKWMNVLHLQMEENMGRDK